MAEAEREMLLAAFHSLIHSLAVELNADNRLYDQALGRIEQRVLQKIKNADFKDPAWPLAEQVRLMDIAVEAVQTEMKYIRKARDDGNLKPYRLSSPPDRRNHGAMPPSMTLGV
jgi:hypothetical protein